MIHHIVRRGELPVAVTSAHAMHVMDEVTNNYMYDNHVSCVEALFVYIKYVHCLLPGDLRFLGPGGATLN
ncbi:hypothetical protein PoB_003651000 [Plakobranchus ocellatus]|uniref:Uncharacterized protein n=1 Tax=Plakobranchus ocellatus TaxID=259542 RepID=A0AAV4ASZ3_9GAST|nr:hypothetical protein PoB_003651000 [Plakobranchus ocellatus]